MVAVVESRMMLIPTAAPTPTLSPATDASAVVCAVPCVLRLDSHTASQIHEREPTRPRLWLFPIPLLRRLTAVPAAAFADEEASLTL